MMAKTSQTQSGLEGGRCGCKAHHHNGGDLKNLVPASMRFCDALRVVFFLACCCVQGRQSRWVPLLSIYFSFSICLTLSLSLSLFLLFLSFSLSFPSLSLFLSLSFLLCLFLSRSLSLSSSFSFSFCRSFFLSDFRQDTSCEGIISSHLSVSFSCLS